MIPAMRMLFMGSVPTLRWSETRALGEQEQPFARAARDLGYEASRRGHSFILSADHIASVDYHVMAGIQAYCDEHPGQSVDVHVNRSEGSRALFADRNPSIRVTQSLHTELDAELKGTASLVPNLAALDASDVAILIGGRTTARLIGSVGADRDGRVIAIPSFGGAASELYEKLKYTYRARLGPQHQGLAALNSIWDESSAGLILDLAEAFCAEPPAIPAHTYFLSYRWDDSAQADHVELLLLRNGRKVLRDEGVFDAGENLSEAIKAMIGESDTYIALHSSAFDRSDFCPGELAYATRRQRNGDKPRRVVMLAVESYDPNDIPIEHAARLWKPGVERAERELAIRQLIEQEPRTDVVL